MFYDLVFGPVQKDEELKGIFDSLDKTNQGFITAPLLRQVPHPLTTASTRVKVVGTIVVHARVCCTCVWLLWLAGAQGAWSGQGSDQEGHRGARHRQR